MEKNRSTRQKQLILDILQNENAPMTAMSLYRQAVACFPNIAKSTVYRNLEAMVGRGEVERGFLENGEAFYRIVDHKHHHYMICRECNRMQDLPVCPVKELEQVATDSGFVPMEHIVQVYGYCRDCATRRS